ncbi:hypothetical protein TcasGA2_TC032453 [Tribolium castaneum]|uniref:Uncharacterized protein n=1 Tax=Tribolium castaneum TaxID=7070 RepID=A0A139WLQ6_TRICA|nr:hypothetical protein TcasGA2_TC032453 [Tribolium castaneum]
MFEISQFSNANHSNQCWNKQQRNTETASTTSTDPEAQFDQLLSPVICTTRVPTNPVAVALSFS